MTAWRILYWNDGRPVLIGQDGCWRLLPTCLMKENWRIWCRRYRVCFVDGPVRSKNVSRR